MAKQKQLVSGCTIFLSSSLQKLLTDEPGAYIESRLRKIDGKTVAEHSLVSLKQWRPSGEWELEAKVPTRKLPHD